jgi:hypothetical protein
MSRWSLAAAASSAARTLADDLTAHFGPRLESLVAYGRWVHLDGPAGAEAAHAEGQTGRPGEDAPLHTLALAVDLGYADLTACADRAERWRALGLATPLLLSRDEFVSSLDAFPIEFGDIIERHMMLAGRDPFDGVRVRHEDLRRACEVQARSHLIHLREGFLEAGGRPDEVGRLIRNSVASFGTLLGNLARLQASDGMTVDALARFAETRLDVSGALVRRLLGLARPLPPDEALQLYPPYHEASAAIAARVDRWKGPTGA